MTNDAGLFGAIRARLLRFPQIVSVVGNKIQPGRVSAGWTSQVSTSTTVVTAPYILMTDIGGQYKERVVNLDGSYIDCFETYCQIAVFGNGYQQTWALANDVYSIVANQWYNVGNIAVWLQPKGWHEIIQPTRSETGADIWQTAIRFYYWNVKAVASLTTISQVNGTGRAVFPAFGSAGTGTAS